MQTHVATVDPPRWDLAAENIVVKIRWFGLFLGYLYVNTARDDSSRFVLNAILALGNVYTLLDTYYSLRGRVFLGQFPLTVSAMESLFIGLLCHYQGGLDSAFRYYYLLSILCCAIRHTTWVTYVTCGLHCFSVSLLYGSIAPELRDGMNFGLSMLVLVWMTWASNALALLLKRIGEHLGQLNAALRENQGHLEARIAERTRELQEVQAQLLHQEKMAAFGLLAAGIAHEVGNPLTSISSIVQILTRRDTDGYTREKLDLVGGQLSRIQAILRELVNFSRPASTERTKLNAAEVVDEALRIAKYYPGTKSRRIAVDVPADLPPIVGVRGELVQVFLNLVLNAVDATGKNERIELYAERGEGALRVRIRDAGHGVPEAQRDRLFEPYFTTKKHGTGLGLFVVRKLVAGQGGQVTFAPSELGGAEFTVSLPWATAN